MTVAMFVAGLVLLVAGGEALVRGASRLALASGLSPLVVGLTVVAIGTSAPELAVSVQASVSGSTDLAIGNVVGSNILNVLLILGASALIAPLLVARQLVRQEVPVMIGVSLLLIALCADRVLSVGEGALLVGLLIVYTIALVVRSRREAASVDIDFGDQSSWDRHWSVQVLLLAAGLTLLVIGARWLVAAALEFARDLGLSELVIGITIVAAGTSLPEAATSIIAALRGQRDIAVGNVVGSNIFNILGVLGVSAAVAPAGLAVAPPVATFDLPVMVAVAVVCLPIFFTGYQITRWEGLLFLALYAAYIAYLLLAGDDHAALPLYSNVMLYSVLPSIAMALTLLTWREWQRRQRGAAAG
jgi:cation:H+ antiporter